MDHLVVIIITAMIPHTVTHISELNRWSQEEMGFLQLIFLAKVYLQRVLNPCGKQSQEISDIIIILTKINSGVKPVSFIDYQTAII